MAKISLTYPESWLTVKISILNQKTGVEDFSGIANEIGRSKTYVFAFNEFADADYTYIATVTGYDTMSGSLFNDNEWFLKSRGWRVIFSIVSFILLAIVAVIITDSTKPITELFSKPAANSLSWLISK